MASAVYDHIVAIAIIGVIFVGTVVTLPALTYSNLQTVDQQQLRNTALNVFDSMLLGQGYPSKWGSDPSFDQDTSIELFGLASSTALSKFVLDTDKVQRLDPSNNGTIEYERVRDLLDIEDYGFQLTILRPFTTSWSLDIQGDTVYYYLAVTKTEDGTPIPNAQVRISTTVALTPSSGNQGDFNITKLDPLSDVTNPAGICEGTQDAYFPGYTVTHAASVMQISVAGMSTTVVARDSNLLGQVIKLHTSGNEITLSLPTEIIENDTHSERRIFEIDVYDSETSYPIYDEGKGLPPPDVKMVNGAGYDYWKMTYPGLENMEATALLFWVETTVKHSGRELMLIAGPMDAGDPGKILTFGPDPRTGDVIAVIRRLVAISDMTYVAQITFWRENI